MVVVVLASGLWMVGVLEVGVGVAAGLEMLGVGLTILGSIEIWGRLIITLFC